jgi:hypothetical protein
LNFTNVIVIRNDKNIGFGCGNNLGAKYANGEYLIILNPDTIVESDWLEELISPLQSNDRLITTPKILLYNGSGINTCGNLIHFTGLSFVRGLGLNPNSYSIREYVSEVSGCCFAIRKSDFIDLGGFDETIFLYYEDVEFSSRAYLKGYKLLYVPRSIVRHDYKLKVTPNKIYLLEMGRYLFLKKFFSIKDIILFSPSLLIVEFLTWVYSIRCGHLGIINKSKAILEAITRDTKPANGDRLNWFSHLYITIPTDQLSSNKLDKYAKIISNSLFTFNIKIIKLFYSIRKQENEYFLLDKKV